MTKRAWFVLLLLPDSAVSVGLDLSKISIIPLPDMGASETQYEKLDLEFNQPDGTQSSIGSEASSDRLKEFMQANEGYKTEFCKF